MLHKWLNTICFMCCVERSKDNNREMHISQLLLSSACNWCKFTWLTGLQIAPQKTSHLSTSRLHFYPHWDSLVVRIHRLNQDLNPDLSPGRHICYHYATQLQARLIRIADLSLVRCLLQRLLALLGRELWHVCIRPLFGRPEFTLWMGLWISPVVDFQP